MDRLEVEVEAQLLSKEMEDFYEWKDKAICTFEPELEALHQQEIRITPANADNDAEDSKSWWSWMWSWCRAPFRSQPKTSDTIVASPELLDFKLEVDHKISTFDIRAKELAARVCVLWLVPITRSIFL